MENKGAFPQHFAMECNQLWEKNCIAVYNMLEIEERVWVSDSSRKYLEIYLGKLKKSFVGEHIAEIFPSDTFNKAMTYAIENLGTIQEHLTVKTQM